LQDGSTALHLAAAAGDTNIIDKLMSKNPLLNAKDEKVGCCPGQLTLLLLFCSMIGQHRS
jgi:ankyrin repeat protein